MVLNFPRSSQLSNVSLPHLVKLPSHYPRIRISITLFSFSTSSISLLSPFRSCHEKYHLFISFIIIMIINKMIIIFTLTSYYDLIITFIRINIISFIISGIFCMLSISIIIIIITTILWSYYLFIHNVFLPRISLEFVELHFFWRTVRWFESAVCKKW